MIELVKSHRALGRLVERTDRHVVFQTSPQPGGLLVQPSHMTQPATDDDAVLAIRFDLAEIIERARFLGVSTAELRVLFVEEMSRAAE